MITYLDSTPRKSTIPIDIKSGGPGSGIYDHKHNFTKYNLPEGVGKETAKAFPLHSTWYRHPNYSQHAYGGVMVNNAGQFLLREPSGHFDGYNWTWPKGKMNHPDEHPVDVALRELKEETGYHGRIFDAVPGTFVSGSGSRSNYYLMRSHGQNTDPDWETHGLKWVDYHEAKDLIKQSPNRLGRLRDLAILEYARNRIEKHRKIESMADIDVEATAYSELGEYLCQLGSELEAYLFTIACGWDETKHPRMPAGGAQGGEFAPGGGGGTGKATGKYHQHATLLKAFGWKMKDVVKGPNPEHPEKTSVLKSTWTHPQFGTIDVNHSKHIFTHTSNESTGLVGNIKYQHPTGKSNVVLEQHLIQHHAEPNDVAKPATSAVVTPIQKVPVTDEKSDKMTVILEKYGYTKASESGIEQKYTKDAVSDSPLVKQHIAYVTKNTGSVGHYPYGTGVGYKSIKTPEELEQQLQSVHDQVAPKGQPPPGKLVEQYTHVNYGHVYTWNPDTKMYKSSQGKELAPNKLAWMQKQQLVKPTSEGVEAQPTPVSKSQLEIHQQLEKAGYTYHHSSPLGNKIYSHPSGTAVKVIGNAFTADTFTPGKLGPTDKFIPDTSLNNKLPISELATHLSYKPYENTAVKHDMAYDIAQKKGFDYSSDTDGKTYFKKPNGDLLTIDKKTGAWKHLTSDDYPSDDYPSAKGTTPGELEQYLSKSGTKSQPAVTEDQSAYKYAGIAHELGGAFQKHFFTDDTGNKYLFKVAHTLSGQGDPLKAHVDETASKIQAILRPDTNVPVKTTRMNLPDKASVLGSIQKMITNLDEKANFKGVNPANLKIEDVKGLQQEHVVDWLIANHDAHGAQFVRTTDGKTYGIDKTQAFKHLGKDELSMDYHLNKGEEEPYYNKLFTAIKENNQMFDPQNSLAPIQKAQSIPNDEYKAMLKPYVDSRFKSEDDKKEFYQQALDRKANLKSDFEKFYSDVLGNKFKFGEGLGKSDTVPEASHDALNAYGWHKNFDGQKVDAYKQAGSTKYLTVDKTTGSWSIKDTGNNSVVKQGNDFSTLDAHITGGKTFTKSTAKGNVIQPPEIYSDKPDKISQEMHQALEDTGFKFEKYGSNSGMPLYKDPGGKGVYVKPDNSFEYYPMGTSGPGKTYGAQTGTGTKALTEAVTTPFEKPVAQQSEEYGSGKSSHTNINPVTGALGTPNYPELKDVPYKPISDKLPQNGKGKEAGYQIGGTPSQTVDLIGDKIYSPSEKGAIQYYKGSGYSDINPWLAAKKDNPLDDSSTANRVKLLDSAMQKGVINKDQILFRAVNYDYAQDLVNTLQIGSLHTPYSFQSTATHQSFSHDSWSSGDKLLFRIKVPKGTNAIAVEKAKGQSSGSDGEHEVILPRNVVYKVTDIYHSGGKIYADVDLVKGSGVKIKAMAKQGSAEHYAEMAYGAKDGNELDMALGTITNPDGTDGTPLNWKLTAEEVMERAQPYSRHKAITSAISKLQRMVSRKK